MLLELVQYGSKTVLYMYVMYY